VWERDLDERIALRKEVVEAHLSTSASKDGQITIRGRDTPEALLPWELFESLIARAFAPQQAVRDAFRIGMNERARELGLPTDPWPILEATSSHFLASRAKQAQLAARLASALPSERTRLLSEIKGVQAADCWLRTQAIGAIRAAFDDGVFDRFLYEVVASSLTITTRLTSEEEIENLRFIERGCR
jgi:hypothetical protein